MKPRTARHAVAQALAATPCTTRHAFTGADGIERTTELRVLPVLPASPFRTVDGRSGIVFSYDAAALIATHRARGRRLPVDVEHATEGTQADTRARGWVVDLTTADERPELGLEAGVLYALVELTPLGEQELADRLYGYTSGVAVGAWLDETSVTFTRIKSLALTNSPATEMPMAFTAEDDADADIEDAGYTQEQSPPDEHLMPLEHLRALLGLPADADAAAIDAAIAALTAQRTEAATFTATLTAERDTHAVALTAAKEQVIALTAERDAVIEQLNTARAAEAERVVLSAVEDAVRAGRVTPAQREQALVMARADLNAFTAFVAAAPALVSQGVAHAPALDEAHGLTAEQQQFCRQQGIDPAIYARNLRHI